MNATELSLRRRAFFAPCKSKEALHRWIRTYLGLELPDTVVCDDDVRVPSSNSSPMDLIWELYSAAMGGGEPDKTFYLAYAARDSGKTVSCAILEVLCLLHLRRDVGHLAAVEGQAQNCQRYVEAHFKRPILCDFLTSKNKRTIEVTRYESADGNILSPAEYEALSDDQKGLYQESTNFIQILVATLSGTNSLHCSMLVLDELDLAPPKPVEEAKMIPAPGRNGELPIIFMTSSRKFNYGLVQNAIDEAAKTGLNIRHWNLIDVTRTCPVTRHLPDLPKVDIRYSENLLRTYTQEEYEALPPKDREGVFLDQGYAGCVRNCKMFPMCRGRLATKQRADSKSPLLKPIVHSQSTFGLVTIETAKAQLMCWKPSTEGIVYPRFDRKLHMKTVAEMVEMVTGLPSPSSSFLRDDLVALMKNRGLAFFMGMDYGFGHAYAGVVAAVDGGQCYVFDAFEIPGLELDQRIELCNGRVKYLNPTIYPDTAYPADNKTFRRHGYNVRNWNKGKGSVLEGIEAVRFKLNPLLGPPQLFFLSGDPGCELLAKRLGSYHWVMDAAGRPTDIPDDTEDDVLDALRYMIQNVFPFRKQGVQIDKTPVVADAAPEASRYSLSNWMAQVIEEQTGNRPIEDEAVLGGGQPKGRKGGFVWDVG